MNSKFLMVLFKILSVMFVIITLGIPTFIDTIYKWKIVKEKCDDNLKYTRFMKVCIIPVIKTYFASKTYGAFIESVSIMDFDYEEELA